MSVSQSLIITSIAPPNEVLKGYADACSKNGNDFIIITPTQMEVNWTIAERQEELSYEEYQEFMKDLREREAEGEIY